MYSWCPLHGILPLWKHAKFSPGLFFGEFCTVSSFAYALSPFWAKFSILYEIRVHLPLFDSRSQVFSGSAVEIILSPLSVLDSPAEEQLTRRGRVISGLHSIFRVCMSASMPGLYHCQSLRICDVGRARKSSPSLLFKSALALQASWFLTCGRADSSAPIKKKMFLGLLYCYYSQGFSQK